MWRDRMQLKMFSETRGGSPREGVGLGLVLGKAWAEYRKRSDALASESVLLVEEPGGDKLGEGGVRGGEGVSDRAGIGRGWILPLAFSDRVYIAFEK